MCTNQHHLTTQILLNRDFNKVIERLLGGESHHTKDESERTRVSLSSPPPSSSSPPPSSPSSSSPSSSSPPPSSSPRGAHGDDQSSECHASVEKGENDENLRALAEPSDAHNSDKGGGVSGVVAEVIEQEQPPCDTMRVLLVEEDSTHQHVARVRNSIRNVHAFYVMSTPLSAC